MTELLISTSNSYQSISDLTIECPICLEEFSQSEIDSNQTIQCNGCSQHFHENCIREWCESNITNRLCPICREPNICTNNDFNLDQPEPEPSQISDIITSLGLEHGRLQIINDTQIAEENTRFNALDSYDQMTIWVSDHLEEFINNINNSETNHDDEWVNETANNREENARIFREEVQRATFNRDLPVWFIAPRPEDSLDIQHLRDLYQLIVFTYNEYDRLKTEYPEYSYFELLFSSEKRNIHYKRAAAKRKLEDLQLRTFTYSMILITKDTFSREANIVGGAKQADFLINLHKLLTNQEYSNIISYTFDNDGNILILLKDKLLVAKEVCPRSANIDFHSCARQFCNYGFKTETRLSIEGIDKNNGLIFSNPKVKSIDDILTLERKLPQSCRKSPTIDDGNRDIANLLIQLSSRSTDMDNNEAANVLASIANIDDKNTEDLDRRTSYLQNLITNNEHSLKIALLIESLKNHVIDENEKNQIKQKQNELWQSLKEIELDNTKRKDILYKYMFEYLKRTIPQAKLNEGAKIAQSTFQSIQRAQIHNRPTEPLTESEQKQADEKMNASISRGQMLAQDEDTNMEDVQSPNAPFRETPWWEKGGITDKALIRLHSEPVDGHMIEVYYGDHWKLGRAVRKTGRSLMILKPLFSSAGERQAESIRQIVTEVDYIDGTSVDELLHRGDWKQRQNPVMKGSEDPKYWRYAKSNSRSQSGGVIYVDDEIIGSYKS